MSLYTEIRPSKLDEIVGNQGTIRALEKMLQSSRKPHAILLRGPSGCGKTTLARILATEFGSHEESIFEMNAANTRNIDDIREIARTAPLSTFAGGAKTYIVDESHQLTAAAQQAFLKVLEDCPVNCFFVLCTTDPANLIPTIRNRCTDYEVRKLKAADLIILLERACEKAKLNVPPQIIQAVVATSEGSPRATLVALEKVQDIEDLDTAIELLLKGTEYDSSIIDLCKLMNANPDVRRNRWSQIIWAFDQIKDSEPERIRKSIMTYLYKMLVTCENPEEALDLAHLIRIFSGNCFYGGKSMLGALVAQACFAKNSYLND